MTEDEELQKLRDEAANLGLDTENLEPQGWDAPSHEVKDNIYKFFRDVLKEEDSTRIGNVKDEELGRATKSIRALHNIADYAEVEELDKVSEYIRNKALTITSTSMSRKGWFLSLAVTQIKKELKSMPSSGQQKKWTLFGRAKTEDNENG